MTTTQRHTVRDGLIIGLIGYFAVALFYGAFDFLAARGTFYTVNVLGRAVFRGFRDPSLLDLPLGLDTTAIFEYNVLHLALALTIGFVVASLVRVAEENPQLRAFVRVVIIGGFVATVAAVGFATMPLRSVVPWWSILLANAAATVLAGAYLISTHPGVWRGVALAEVEPRISMGSN